eukprot:731985-Rhodomonas_salina.2
MPGTDLACDLLYMSGTERAYRAQAFWQNVRRLQGVNQEFVDPDNRLGRNGELRAGTGYEIMVGPAIGLRACYAMSGTDVASGLCDVRY